MKNNNSERIIAIICVGFIFILMSIWLGFKIIPYIQYKIQKSKNPYCINISDVKLSKEVKKKINDKKIEKLLQEYLNEEVKLFNNNTDYAVIDQTAKTKELEEKIMALIVEDDENPTEEQRERNIIYYGITNISRTMFLEQNLYEIKGKKNVSKERYDEYMKSVKFEIDNVIRKYCK